MREPGELLLPRNPVGAHQGKNRENNFLGLGNSTFKGPEAGKREIKNLSKGDVAEAQRLGEEGLRPWCRGRWELRNMEIRG